MNCEYYNFGLYNNIGSSEECDCPGDYLYLYNEDGTLTCENRLDEAVCPSYYRFGSNESDHCYICNRGCKREKVYKGFCGDGIPQNSNCSSVTQAGCQTVPGADEECDDGNDSNTDSCTNDCKKAKCGDGFIQAGENCDSGILNGHYATDCIGTESCPGCASSDCQGSGPSCGDSIVQHKNKCSDNAFLADNGFSSRADCEAKLASAEEVCDEGSNNGMPIKFQKFLDTPEAEGCAMEIKGVKQPVNAIHEKYAECVYKYQQYLNDNPGCSGDCTVARTAYCGDGKKDPGEECDEGLPVSNYNSGVYSIAEKENYNGKGYNHCKLDCSGTYKCSNGSLEKRSCTDTNSEDKCRSIGDDVTGVVYVKDANEKCDDGRYNGQYGYCAVGCQTNVGCGNGVSNECYKHNGSYCEEAEDCDKGDGNVTLDKAWSFSPGGTCVVENKELCKGNRWTDPDASDYIDVRCCVYGRYCGDGNVDNGFGVGISSSNEWRNRDNWTVSGLTVEEYPRELAMRFRLNGSEGTAELNVALPVNGKLRYIIEYNLMRSSTSDTPGGAKSGVNQYYVDSEGTTTLLVADDPNALNANPFFVVDSEGATHPNDTWSHHIARGISGFSQSATNMWLKVRDGGTDENPEFKETKAVKIFFKFTGNEGMDFYLRGLKFYTIEAGNPPSDAGAAYEMCDHDGNPKTVSSDYMTDCNDQCKWLNYCGDRIIQNQNCVDDDSCVSIQGAFEVCDNGTNQTNVYNGCEPGCLELGPRCGDGILDKGSCSCLGQENCDCNTPSGINTYEKCDKGLLNSNDAYSFNYDADMTLDLNLNSYRGDGCREDCMQPRCGDGIRDDVKKRIKRLLYKQKTDGNGALVYEKDKNGNLIYDRDNNLIPVYTTEPVLDENGNQMEEWVSEYVEECDCGDAKHYYDSTRTTTVYVKGELFYICQKNDAGEPLYNTTFSGRAAVCRPNCTVSRCGDGIKDPDEECDDGNFDDHDSCTSDCKLAKCGGEGDTADNKLAFKRSYLCEELLDISSAEMTKMRDRGVVDCGSQCSLFSTNMSGTNAAAKMREYFEAGVLHCCYNQKYNVGGIDDNNCEFIRNGEYVKPKKMVIDNCIANAWKNDGSSWRHFTEEECEAHEIYAHSFELCDSSCKDADCGCSEKYPGNETKIKQCIENNLYCDATCWNRIGKCGDGRVDNGTI